MKNHTMGDQTIRFFPGKPIPISEAIENFLNKEGLAERIQVYQIMDRFGEFFPSLSSYCRCCDFRDGVLYLSVNDPVYSLEVQKVIPDICRVYNEQGMKVIKVKIRCAQTE